MKGVFLINLLNSFFAIGENLSNGKMYQINTPKSMLFFILFNGDDGRVCEIIVQNKTDWELYLYKDDKSMHVYNLSDGMHIRIKSHDLIYACATEADIDAKERLIQHVKDAGCSNGSMPKCSDITPERDAIYWEPYEDGQFKYEYEL
jgi:hypothetical protein